MDQLTECQRGALDVSKKKAKIHQNGLMYLIKNRLIDLNISESFIEDFHAFVNNDIDIVTHTNLKIQDVLVDPVLKNVYQTKTKSESYISWRTVAESKKFNKKYDNASDEERPKYGSLNITKNNTGNPLCTGYGGKVLIFHNEIKKRSSFVYGDSFSQHQYMCTFEYPHALLYHMKEEMSKLFDIVNGGTGYIPQYIEVQIHGHVNIVTDVKKILVPKDAFVDEFNSIQQFRELYPHIEICKI